mgnify:CR=1 FL=1
MMERIEMLRDKLDRVYNATVYRLIGAVGVCYAAKVLLATSMFDGMSAWLIAVVMGALFFFKPGVAIFANALVLCLSLAHINALLAVVIAALTLFFCGCNHVLSFWVMLLPLCFLPGNVFSGWQFCALLVGLCLLSRIGSKQLCVLYGVYYSLLTLVSGFGGVFAFHYRRVYYTNAQAYLRSLNFKQMYQALLRCNITALIIVIAIYGVLAALLYLFAKVRLGKKLAFDATDGLKFLIAAAALTAAVFGTAMVFAVDDALPVGAIVLQMVAAYLISRPFASETMVHKLSAGDAAMEGSKNAVSNAEITFDKWDSIAGYEETKKEIQSIIRPYTDKREYDRLVKAGMAPVKGLLLFGPPGTGKTTMARIIANETKMKLIVVNASSFLNMYVGESEKNLVRVFQQARDKAPCIICFDEIESFLMDRSKAERSYETSIVSTFLAQMDGYVDLQDVLVVATTNNPTLIDPAALRPGRFDKQIYVGVPDEAARAVMFEKYLRGKAGTGVDYQKLAENSERFTGADIRGLCEAAFRENDFKPVTEEQLMMRLSITRPSYTLEMQKMYELWGKKYNRSSGAQEDNRNKTAKHLCWDDIKGMDSVKALLREKIELPIQNAEQYKKYGISAPKGILLFGPPGCGKTFFAKVAADESKAAFYVVNGPELLGRGVGESEENLRKAFMDARETKPSILFFDEIDAIAEARSTNAGSVRIINQLLTEMDGMESLSGVTVIAATNRPESLDPALLRAGRFDTKIYIPLPDQDSIRQMVLGYLGDVPNDADVDAVTAALAGYTCADVAAIVNKAKVLYVHRSVAGKEEPLHTGEILDIISRAKSSVSPEDAAAYEKQRSLESWT